MFIIVNMVTSEGAYAFVIKIILSERVIKQVCILYHFAIYMDKYYWVKSQPVDINFHVWSLTKSKLSARIYIGVNR